jgi:hypothetical protein
MNFELVAAEYVRTHRADCTDAEIRKALKEQGFSDKVLADAFDLAGERPDPPPARSAPLLRAVVWLLWTTSAFLFIGAAVLFFHNLMARLP